MSVTPIRFCMNMKKFRHFLCGLLCGAAGTYWYTLHSGATLDGVLSVLEDAAQEYQSTHDTPKANSGWRPSKGNDGNRL